MYSFPKHNESIGDSFKRMNELGERREHDTKLRKDMRGTSHAFAKAIDKKKKK